MAEPLLVRESTAEKSRQLRCHADIYDEVPLCRLAERSEPPASVDADEELPRDDDVLLDTALHQAVAEWVARARGSSAASGL
jgi:hypothetical protein